MFFSSTRHLDAGDNAPLFTLKNQNGQDVVLANLLRQGPVALFFYPKDDTAGCTAQVCAFEDAYEAFLDIGASVVGISSDSVASHRSFAGRHALRFDILSDPEKAVRRAFGVPKSLGLIAGRVTYIIDSRGVIRHTFNSQFYIKSHIAQALEQVRHLRSTEPVDREILR